MGLISMPTGLARTRTHGGNPWELMRQRRLSKDQIIDFSVDVNPLGFPAVVRSTILEHLDDIRGYPDPSATELREAIAAYHQVPAESILPGNGTAELIGVLARLPQVKKCAIVVPTFGEYEWVMEQAGVTTALVQSTEPNEFRLDIAQQDWPRLLKDVDVVVLCNPNNPTGVATSKDGVLEIAHWCHEVGARLIVDEAFVEFLEHPDKISVVAEALQLGHVVVLRSLTKLFAIPGLRLGYLVACPAIVEELRAFQPAWPLNTFALAVGIELLKETDYVARSRQAIAKLRDELQQSLGALPGLQPFPSVTNFVLCRLADADITSSELCDRLVDHGLLIRNCDSFMGLEPGRFIRIAVRSREDHERLVTALREILSHAR